MSYVDTGFSSPLDGGVTSGTGGFETGTGGAAGTFIPVSGLDLKMDFDTLKMNDAVLGSGAVIIFDNSRNMIKVLQSILEFFKHESCGKCVPCRVGTQHLFDEAKRLYKYDNILEGLNKLKFQSEIMAKTSLCPLGQSPLMPINSLVKYWETDYK